MNSKVVAGGALSIVALIATSSLVSGVNFTGWFKAFDKTLAAGEQYEKNITVRKYYNVSVRFQKENSTSYLTFDDNDSLIVLKNAAGAEIANVTGVKNGRAYIKLSNVQLASVATVSAAGIGSYADVVQPVNDTMLSLSGTTAYLTVKVRYPSASMSGYVTDDLTGDAVVGVLVAAFEDGADANATASLVQAESDANGRYAMSFATSDSESVDVYVAGYDVV